MHGFYDTFNLYFLCSYRRNRSNPEEKLDTEGKIQSNQINVEQIVKLDFREGVTPTFRM